MPNLPWFKVYTEIIDNYKLRSLSDAQKWRFLQLLAIAGECSSEGYLVHSGKPLQVVDIAWRLRMNSTEMLSDLQALASQDLILLDKATGAWLIPGFARRQARPDEETRAYWREKKRQERGANHNTTASETGSGNENVSEFDQEDFSDMQAEEVHATPHENVPLKRRIEENRGEKRQKESRPGERQRPPSSGREKAKSQSGLSVYDLVERELAQKNLSPPGSPV